MKRTIIGFHQDPTGDWVAELDCGHRQHVRHTPPWINHPWVQTPEGRRQHVGAELQCSECEPPRAAAATAATLSRCDACGSVPAAWRKAGSAPEDADEDAVCFLTDDDFAQPVQFCAACFERRVPPTEQQRRRAWIRLT